MKCCARASSPAWAWLAVRFLPPPVEARPPVEAPASKRAGGRASILMREGPSACTDAKGQGSGYRGEVSRVLRRAWFWQGV